MEREELIRELAEKLITANTEKEEIFLEYEKILQTTVFHKQEDNTPNQHKQLPKGPLNNTIPNPNHRDTERVIEDQGN